MCDGGRIPPCIPPWCGGCERCGGRQVLGSCRPGMGTPCASSMDSSSSSEKRDESARKRERIGGSAHNLTWAKTVAWRMAISIKPVRQTDPKTERGRGKRRGGRWGVSLPPSLCPHVLETSMGLVVVGCRFALSLVDLFMAAGLMRRKRWLFADGRSPTGISREGASHPLGNHRACDKYRGLSRQVHCPISRVEWRARARGVS